MIVNSVASACRENADKAEIDVELPVCGEPALIYDGTALDVEAAKSAKLHRSLEAEVALLAGDLEIEVRLDHKQVDDRQVGMERDDQVGPRDGFAWRSAFDCVSRRTIGVQVEPAAEFVRRSRLRRWKPKLRCRLQCHER